MPEILGIDTSNYTTSAALLAEGSITQEKMLLPVKQGELGLRQSDAVFHHVRQLPMVLEKLLDGPGRDLQAIGVSLRPRDAEGSYMPCFSVGEGTATAMALATGARLHGFSHQAGHIAAALYSAKRLDLLESRFWAFHVSGGTTEAVLAQPDGNGSLAVKLTARSLDLKGGQAVDRVGVMLGLPFPAGKHLEALAAQSQAVYKIKPSMKGADCSLSGIENQCKKMLGQGNPHEDIAKYCLDAILAALRAMASALLEQESLPTLFAGGVMSNRMISNAMEEAYGAVFAEPAFSADNAAGVAVLAARREGIL